MRKSSNYQNEPKYSEEQKKCNGQSPSIHPAIYCVKPISGSGSGSQWQQAMQGIAQTFSFDMSFSYFSKNILRPYGIYKPSSAFWVQGIHPVGCALKKMQQFCSEILSDVCAPLTHSKFKPRHPCEGKSILAACNQNLILLVSTQSSQWLNMK